MSTEKKKKFIIDVTYLALILVLGYLLLAPFLTTAVLYTIYAAVAGVMVFVTFDGLLPMAQKYGEPHLSLYGLVAGMFVMALGLAIV